MKNCYFIYHRKSNELTAIAIKKEDVSHYTLFRGKENFMSHKVSYPSEEDIKILLSDHIDLVLYQDQKMELLWNNKEKSKIENGIHYLLFFQTKELERSFLMIPFQPKIKEWIKQLEFMEILQNGCILLQEDINYKKIYHLALREAYFHEEINFSSWLFEDSIRAI